jgi:hypothetical protein
MAFNLDTPENFLHNNTTRAVDFAYRAVKSFASPNKRRLHPALTIATPWLS